MNLIFISTLDDARTADYRNLKDRELARLPGGKFIAEGEHVVRRLMASRFPTDSVLLAERRVEEIGPLVPAGVPIYVTSDACVRDIIGFPFHAGVLAVGRRLPSPALADVIPADPAARVTLAVCEEIANAENLGGMIRICAGLGVDALVLGERCHDPFFRRCVRVSMGTVFSLPIVQSNDLRGDLHTMGNQHGIHTYATVAATDAEPLASVRRPLRGAILFGSEAQGLSPAFLAMCDTRVTIPMHWQTDSLNINVAAGIVLYHFCSTGD